MKETIKNQSDFFMREAFGQSCYAIGNSDPNPPVGAVLVNEDGKVTGRGFTQIAGGHHAEVMAITEAVRNSPPESLERSTLYVTLEPCSHFGRTPPCTNLILEKKIPRVVIARQDQNTVVHGIQVLNEQNVDVTLLNASDFKEELLWTLDAFQYYLANRRPRVWLKWAQTSDGFLGPLEGPSGKISGDSSREFIFRMRKMMHSILVTPGTVKTDLPLLTPRYGKHSLEKIFRDESYLSRILNSFEIQYPDEFRSIQKRFFMLPREFAREDSLWKKFRQDQVNAPGKHFFLKNFGKQEENQGNFVGLQNVYGEYLFDFNKFDEIISFIGRQGSLNLMIEAGPGFAKKIIHENHADFLIISRSVKRIWKQGKSFSLSRAMANNDLSQLSKAGFDLLYNYDLEEDHLFIFQRRINHHEAGFWP